MKKIYWLVWGILSIALLSISGAQAQDGGDEEIVYQRHDFTEIGVSLEAPAMWLAEVSESDLGGVTLTMPEQTVTHNDVEYTIPSRQVEFYFLPNDILTDWSLYTTDNVSFTQALAIEVLLHGNPDVRQVHNRDSVELSTGQIIAPLIIYEVNQASHYEYFITDNEGLIWIHSEQGLISAFDLPFNEIFEHMFNSLTIDWSSARVVDEMNTAMLFEYLGISYQNNYDLTWGSENEFTVVSETESAQTFSNTDWRTYPTPTSRFDTYTEAVASFNHFNLSLGDSEDFELILAGLPADVQTGIYQTGYNVRQAGRFSSSDGGTYVVIESVADQQITGKFYFEIWDELFYGQFIDVTIPPISNCHIVGLPSDAKVSLSIDFIDEALDSYDLDEVNGYWFIETEPSNFRYETPEDPNQAELRLHFSSQDNIDDGISLSIELRPDLGASVGIYQTDMENSNYVKETSLNIHFKDASRGITFNGSIIIGEFDEVLTGEFSGALIYNVDRNLYLTLGTISGSFNDLPIPASSCEDSSTS